MVGLYRRAKKMVSFPFKIKLKFINDFSQIFASGASGFAFGFYELYHVGGDYPYQFGVGQGIYRDMVSCVVGGVCYRLSHDFARISVRPQIGDEDCVKRVILTYNVRTIFLRMLCGKINMSALRQ